MATDFNTNVTSSKGGFKPSITDTPLDIRTRVQTESEIPLIPMPFVGMIVHVIDTGKRYEILSLKDKKSGFVTLENGAVDEYRELPYAFKAVVEEALELKANKEEVDEELALKAEKSELEVLATKEELEAAIGRIEIPEVDLEGMATEEYVDGKIDEVAANDIFKADMKTVSTLGGIAAGSDLNGMTIQEVLTKLLYPYVQPTVSASITYNPTGAVYEFGQTVNVTKIGTTISKKSEAITSVKFYMNGSVVEELTEGVANGGSFVHNFDPAQQIVKSIANSYFKVVATDASGKAVTTNTSALNFYYPYYYGVVNDGVAIDQDIVKGLTKDVSAKGQKAYTYTSNNQRMVIAYPKAHGALKSILDPNGFEQLGTFTRTEVSVTGLDGTAQAYYVYANGANTNTNFKMTFKY